MNTHELAQELVLALGDAKELPYPVLKARTLASLYHFYRDDIRLLRGMTSSAQFHTVFSDLRHQDEIARRVRRGKPFYFLTAAGQAHYDALDALFLMDAD